MIRTFFRTAAVVAILCASTGAAHATQAGKPLTDADRAEGEALINDYVLPIMRSSRDVLNIATTDAPGACRMARANEEKTRTLQVKIKAMQARLTTEGKTTEGFGDLIASSQQMIEGAQRTTSAMCGSFLPKTGNPEHDTIVDKVIGMTARMQGAMMDALEAESNDDHAAACGYTRQARAAFSDLMAYIGELRKQIRNGTPDAVTADAQIAEAATVGADLDNDLRACPAA